MSATKWMWQEGINKLSRKDAEEVGKLLEGACRKLPIMRKGLPITTLIGLLNRRSNGEEV